MNNHLRIVGVLALLFTSNMIYHSCSGRGAVETESYAGPGSDWDATINLDGTFQFVENQSSLTISGDWSPQIGPFKKFTVKNSSTPGSVAVGSEAYGFDIPGVAFILKPLSGTQIVTMVTKGGCPTESGTMNWIITKYGTGGNPTTSDLFGVFEYNHSTGAATLPYKYNLEGTQVDVGSESLGTFNCENSEATLSDGGSAKMYINEVGALVNTDTGTPAQSQFIIGFLKNKLSNVNSLSGTYYGLLFKQSAGTVSTVKGVASGSTLSVEEIDTETGLSTSTAGSFSIDSVDLPQEGFVKMTIGTSTVRCMANPNVNFTGKKLLFCAAKDPDGSASDLYNLLLVTE